MSFSNNYKPLFVLHIHHRYFLDEGNKEFGDDLETEKAKKNLLAYNLGDFMEVMPTAKCATILKNWRARFVVNPTNLQVFLLADPSNSAKPFIGFSEDFVLDFTFRFKDPYFENYTDIELDKNKLIMLSNRSPEESVKEDAVTVGFKRLSKYKSQGNLNDKTIDLIKDIDASELIGKSGFIRIHLEGQGIEMDLVAGDEFAVTTPEETIEFKNRKTFWQYIKSEDGSVLHTTGGRKPLTKNGYLEVKKAGVTYPNPSVDIIHKGDASKGEDDTQYYSKTYL